MASHGRRWWVVAVVAAVGLVSQVAVAWAVASRFADVPPSNPFVDDIEWVADAGVTLGCGDGTNYCPTDSVTRQQMAAFMHRLAVNQVVDAATVQGLEPADLKGDSGPQGPKGDPGVVGFYTKDTHTAASTPGYYTGIASCNAGDIATGGGVQLHANSTDFRLIESIPHWGGAELPAGWAPTGWSGEVWMGLDVSPGYWGFRTWVVCADLG